MTMKYEIERGKGAKKCASNDINNANKGQTDFVLLFSSKFERKCTKRSEIAQG
tara:strand:+ start:1499 stop:1657 length:159 start_codon:yes stop_codon:yes gene_type:complete